jgi:hypothetical protein
MSAIARYGSTRNHLKLKTRPRFCPVRLILSFLVVYKCNTFYDIQTRQDPKGKGINTFLKNELIKVFEKVKNVKNEIKNLTDKLECFEFNLNGLIIFFLFQFQLFHKTFYCSN